jgi:hypothetical protein
MQTPNATADGAAKKEKKKKKKDSDALFAALEADGALEGEGRGGGGRQARGGAGC